MKTVLFLIASVYVRVYMSNQTEVNAFYTTNTLNTTFNSTITFLNLKLLFKKTTAIHICSESEEILNDLVELYKYDYTAVTIYTNSTPLKTYEEVFIIEVNNHTVRDCEDILYSSQTTVVYVVKEGTTAELWRSLEACLSVAQSPEVLALSLSDGALLQLSPVFPQPRHFGSTDVTQVLRRRGLKLNLQGATLNVGTLFYVPFFISIDTTNKDDYDGIYVELVKEMERQFNFSAYYLVDFYFGTVLSNGTWAADGLGRKIQDGKADIIATNVWQTPEYYNLMDFGPSFYKAKQAFIVYRPEVIEFQWQTILHIFKPEVWFATLGSFVLTVVVYWVGLNWDPRPSTESWGGCVLSLFGSFTGTSYYTRVDEGNTRFSLTSWSVFSLLITTSLSSGIVTRLTVPLYSPRINSVQQLVEGEYSWTLQLYAYYQNSTSLKESMFDLKNYWVQRFDKKYVYMEAEEVNKTAGINKRLAYVALVCGKHLVTLETDGLDDHKYLKNYRIAEEALNEGHVTFGVKKQSFMFQPLTDFTLLLNQAGLMTHWESEVNVRWPEFDSSHLLIEQDFSTFSEPQGLPLYKLHKVFFLLLFGLALASAVFLVEICWYRSNELLTGINKSK